MEVAETSLAYDREEKLPRYARALLPEVWIVDIEQEIVSQYTQPDGSRYVYEFIVPFAVDETLSAAASGKVVGVGIMSGNGESRKSRQSPSMGARGGSGGGGGRGGGGKGPGMGGGSGGGSKSGSKKPSEPYEVWMKVQLAMSDSYAL